ncbi:MAG: hypothetical protein ACLTBR_03475 [Anaerostipes sp.]|uniref:hypothetical protein n=1 Tax=Anaerostipes sp. TaxID=1872530 RepID=UPI003996110A
MGNTSYSDVIELMLSLLHSYELDGIFDDYDTDGLITFLKPYIKFASGELEISGSAINTKRNDDENMFTSSLTDGEQLIIAKFILIGYLTRETYDILQMKLHLQDGSFKTYAEKNNLQGKQDALITLKEEVNWNITKIGYTQCNVWG